jgi:hypothetical protein
LASIEIEERSLPILLSLYELLIGDDFKPLREKYLDAEPGRFLRFILRSIDASFDHPYRVLHRMCKHLSYNLKECYEEICNNLPLPSKSTTKDNEELRSAYAAIQLAYYNLLKFSANPDRHERMNEAFHLSEEYWKTTDLSNQFNLKGLTDLYIAAERFDLAVPYAQKQEDSSFKSHLLSKIFRGRNDPDQALLHIDAALSGRSQLRDYHLAAFLNDKAEILHQMKSSECLSCLTEAIGLQDTPKTLLVWNMKLETWQAEFIFGS